MTARRRNGRIFSFLIKRERTGPDNQAESSTLTFKKEKKKKKKKKGGVRMRIGPKRGKRKKKYMSTKTLQNSKFFANN